MFTLTNVSTWSQKEEDLERKEPCSSELAAASDRWCKKEMHARLFLKHHMAEIWCVLFVPETGMGLQLSPISCTMMTSCHPLFDECLKSCPDLNATKTTISFLVMQQ
jgi:hypothetical protein